MEGPKTHGREQLVEEAAFKVQAVGEAHLVCCVERKAFQRPKTKFEDRDQHA